MQCNVAGAYKGDYLLLQHPVSRSIRKWRWYDDEVLLVTQCSHTVLSHDSCITTPDTKHWLVIIRISTQIITIMIIILIVLLLTSMYLGKYYDFIHKYYLKDFPFSFIIRKLSSSTECLLVCRQEAMSMRLTGLDDFRLHSPSIDFLLLVMFNHFLAMLYKLKTFKIYISLM